VGPRAQTGGTRSRSKQNNRKNLKRKKNKTILCGKLALKDEQLDKRWLTDMKVKKEPDKKNRF
jgi:hypothetical protein